MRTEASNASSGENPAHRLQSHYHENLYGDLPHPHEGAAPIATALPGKLGFSLPNPAPDLEVMEQHIPVIHPAIVPSRVAIGAIEDEPKKKKYAKEAWPGKRPTPALLL